MKKRILALICALLILVPTFAACAESGSVEDQTTAPAGNDPAQTTPPDAATTVEETTAYPVPEIKKLDGYVYRAMVIGNEMWGPIYFAPDGEQNGNVINDALYRREAFLEETYGIEVEHICAMQKPSQNVQVERERERERARSAARVLRIYVLPPDFGR